MKNKIKEFSLIFAVGFLTVACAISLWNNKTPQNLQRARHNMDISYTEGNIVLYMTYLRIMQVNEIKDVETQGGMGFIEEKTDEYTKVSFIMPFVVPDKYVPKVTKLKYYIEGEESPHTVPIEWIVPRHKCVRHGKVVLEIPSDFNFSTSCLFLSLQDDVWYSYMLVPTELTMTMLRENAIPSELNEDGLPLSYYQKIERKLKKH